MISNEATFTHNSTVETTEMVKALITTDPDIELVKTADVETIEVPVAGTSTITYNFLVTNIGETTLNNITPTDPMLGGVIKLKSATLESGGSTTGTATYTVTQAGIVSGLRWLDENGDGMQDEDFSAAADGSTQDDDLQGMTVSR